MTTHEIKREQLATQLANHYLDRYRRQLTTRFYLEGDKDLTKRIQRLLFNGAFRYKTIGIQKIKVKVGNVVPGVKLMKLAPSSWNEHNGSIKEATAVKLVAHATQEVQPVFNEENTVVFKWFEEIHTNEPSPESNFRQGAFKIFKDLFYELLSMIPNATLKILVKKNSSDLKQHQKDILDPKRKNIEMVQGDQDSGIGSVPTEATTGANDQVTKLDLRSNLKEYTEALENLIKTVDEMLGQRSDSVFKNSQASQLEITNSNVAIFAFERELLTNMEIFVEEYNEKFSTNIVLVDYLKDHMMEQMDMENKPGETTTEETGTLFNRNRGGI